MAKAKAEAAEAPKRKRITADELAKLMAENTAAPVKDLPAMTRSSGPTILDTFIEKASEKGNKGNWTPMPQFGSPRSRYHLVTQANKRFKETKEAIEAAVRAGTIYIRVAK